MRGREKVRRREGIKNIIKQDKKKTIGLASNLKVNFYGNRGGVFGMRRIY